MINENAPVKYVVTLKGQRISPPLATKAMAEATILQLPIDQQALVEITVITTDGSQILLG